MTKIIFMGTPEFSVPVLTQLASTYDVVAVVTQPDRPVGRKRVLTPPPVKKAALELAIPVYQPEKLRTSSELEELIALEADLLVTAAYGQILPNSLLESPKHGAINVHASLYQSIAEVLLYTTHCLTGKRRQALRLCIW